MKEIDYSDKELIQITGTYADEIRMFFKRDTWSEIEASFLIAGMLPVEYVDIGLPKLNGETFSDQADKDEIFGYAQSVLELYQSNPDNPKIASPQHFVEWANKKDITIPWLEFAIKNGLYEPKQLSDNLASDKPLHPRTENNYLRLILTLAHSIQDFNPKKPYEAAQLIINETDINISEDTLADYIKKAYELEIKRRD